MVIGGLEGFNLQLPSIDTDENEGNGEPHHLKRAIHQDRTMSEVDSTLLLESEGLRSLVWERGKLLDDRRATGSGGLPARAWERKKNCPGDRGGPDPRGRAGRSMRVSERRHGTCVPRHDIKRISRYLGSGQRESSTTSSTASHTARSASIAGATS
jgi:hypothetical protein